MKLFWKRVVDGIVFCIRVFAVSFFLLIVLVVAIVLSPLIFLAWMADNDKRKLGQADSILLDYRDEDENNS